MKHLTAFVLIAILASSVMADGVNVRRVRHRRPVRRVAKTTYDLPSRYPYTAPPLETDTELGSLLEEHDLLPLPEAPPHEVLESYSGYSEEYVTPESDENHKMLYLIFGAGAAVGLTALLLRHDSTPTTFIVPTTPTPTSTPIPAPEPASWVLLGIGMWLVRKRLR